MSKLSSSFEKVRDHPRGPLIVVNFSGVYPPGSAGNEFAEAMVEFLRSVVAETQPGGIVLDLTRLDYVWGDAIGGLAMPLLAKREPLRAVAIVATGRTAGALAPLLAPNFPMALAGMRLAATREQALALVEQALEREPSARMSAPAEKQATSVEPRCHVIAAREAESRSWRFYFVNDSETAMESVELVAIKYEWGDQYVGGRSLRVIITGVQPEAPRLICEDDGSSETRVDLWLRVMQRDVETWLVFEFPKLYLQKRTTLVSYPERVKGPP